MSYLEDSKKSYNIINGDCLEELKKLESHSVDSLVTDPPAGIGFMGKSWDSDKGGRDAWIAWMTEVMSECLRVMKPGAHGLVWALPRTSHWTATALENAGFEVRDVVTHLFGSGFPKSLNVSKALEKQGLPDTKKWDGFGTALKPASEHWILIRKPLSEKTVAKNVLEHGVGAINIDGCRVEGAFKSGWSKSGSKASSNLSMSGANTERSPKPDNPQGRFPANLVLSHSESCGDDQCDIDCSIQALDEQSLAGGMHSAGKARPNNRDTSKDGKGLFPMHGAGGHRIGDSGGASRFFYCAKVSPGERNASPQKNNHPTVKPQKLMRYFCKLVTPPNGVVLDPFMGSGSTGLAALTEGFKFIGIEKEPEYFEIAKARLKNF